MMRRITSTSVADLFDVAATRRIERRAAAALAAHTLMQRAGCAVARLAMALAPHARCVWIACGPGNNGGDGLEAAAQLRQRGVAVVTTFVGDEARLPIDAAAALRRAREAGVTFASGPPSQWDLGIDALLGIGATRAPTGEMAAALRRLYAGTAPVLSVDMPSGLNPDTGTIATDSIAAPAGATWAAGRFCLSLLTLKPGLFTGGGRDAAGDVWFDDLAVAYDDEPVARLAGPPPVLRRAHASHKGSFGDVAVIGGASGMAGAALLAGSAALHSGAGRVLVGLLDPAAAPVDVSQPELMLRDAGSLDLDRATVVCGCGGGEAVRALLPKVIETSARLVLDADALNAVATDAALQRSLERRASRDDRPTVLTPHPLEAARLLGVPVSQVQADRLAAAKQLAGRFGVVVLKGSGTVVALRDGPVPVVNLTGNGRLATAGTGDVLAGMLGAALAVGASAFDAAHGAVWRHGDRADRWPGGVPLTAAGLARDRDV